MTEKDLKMFNSLNHQENENKSYFEILYYSSQKSQDE